MAEKVYTATVRDPIENGTFRAVLRDPANFRADVASVVRTGGGNGGGAVNSVFGRQGNVTAQFGDYDADQIDDSSTTNKFATQAELDQIATNTADIATNASDISTNASNISSCVKNSNALVVIIVFNCGFPSLSTCIL